MARFMRKGKAKCFFLTAIANTEAPTEAEIAAGVSLGQDIAEINGFRFANNPIMTPDLEHSFVSQIPGEDATDESGLVLYQDPATASTARRTALAKGVDGFIVLFSEGIAGATPAADDVCDVWPVTVSSNSKQYTNDNEAAKYEVRFAMTLPPSEDVTVVAGGGGGGGD